MFEVVQCPFCGEPTEIDVDVGGDDDEGATHEFVQDCDVCCHPIDVRVRVGADGAISVALDRA